MKTILFKIQQFPHVSETFIISQIILAIEEEYEINVLVKDVLDFEKSTHSSLLKEYEIGQKVINDNYDIPKNKFIRLFKAFGFIWKHRRSWGKIQQYIRLKSKFSLTWIYEFAFYSQFKNTDIIHVQYGTNAHPVDILKRVGHLKGRLIVSFHGHDAFFPINGVIQNNGYYNYLFARDNLIIANTPFLAERLAEINCPKDIIEIVPIPVDTSYFYPKIKNHEKEQQNTSFRLISVGRLEKIKGHEWGIMAVSELIRKGFDVTYVIVGEGECRNELDKMIKSKSLEDKVTLLGKKSQADVREELWKSDIFLMTSVTFKRQIKETQGLVSLEAQACGLPVVAFDSGGVRYTLIDGKTGYLCKEGDLLQYINAIEKIILNPILRKEFGYNAREYVTKEYSKSVISAKWREIYK